MKTVIPKAPPDHRLVVFNMAKSLEDISRRMYLCPSEENDFKVGFVHHEARYGGCYVGGGAKYIAEIGACVRVGKISDEVLWKFTHEADESLIGRAREALNTTSSINRVPPRLVFLFEKLASTDLVYDFLGGVQQSRIYFDLTDLAPTDIHDLATKLRDVPWSVLPKWKAD
jgi:hypothetical protein